MCVNKRSDCRDITHLLVAAERPHLYFRHGKVPANTRSCRECSLRQLRFGPAHPVSPRKAAIVFRIDDHFSLAGGQQVFRDLFLLMADQDLSPLDGFFHHDGLTYIGMRYRVAVPVIAEQTVLGDLSVAHVAGVVVRLKRDRAQVLFRQPFVRDFLRGRVPARNSDARTQWCARSFLWSPADRDGRLVARTCSSLQNLGSARSSAHARLGSRAPRFSCCRSAPPRSHLPNSERHASCK